MSDPAIVDLVTFFEDVPPSDAQASASTPASDAPAGGANTATFASCSTPQSNTYGGTSEPSTGVESGGAARPARTPSAEATHAKNFGKLAAALRSRSAYADAHTSAAVGHFVSYLREEVAEADLRTPESRFAFETGLSDVLNISSALATAIFDTIVNGHPPPGQVARSILQHVQSDAPGPEVAASAPAAADPSSVEVLLAALAAASTPPKPSATSAREVPVVRTMLAAIPPSFFTAG